jgi:hypothetical protein
MRHIPLSLAVAFTIAVPALAQPPASPNQQVNVNGQRLTGPPGEVVCRTQRETGSRLKAQRVCMTRLQWSEQRRTDRADVEKAQTNRIRP